MNDPSLTLYNLKPSERLLIYRIKKFITLFINDKPHFLCNAVICSCAYDNL